MDQEMIKRREEAMGYLIGKSSRLLHTRLSKNFAEAGMNLTAEQAKILFHLWVHDGQNHQELSVCVLKDKASVSRLVSTLEGKSLVVRVPDKDDMRNKLVYLTQKAKDLKNTVIEFAMKTQAEALEGVDEQEWEITKKVLRQIMNNLSGDEFDTEY